MWEFKCHDWDTLQWAEKPKKEIPKLLEVVLDSDREEEWEIALGLLEAYASDLGVPSEATKDVVACLVAIVVRMEAKKRTVILGVLDELTCGRGIEAYSPQQMMWIRAAVRELVTEIMGAGLPQVHAGIAVGRFVVRDAGAVGRGGATGGDCPGSCHRPSRFAAR